MRISLLYILLISSLSVSAKPVLELSEEIVDFGAVRLDETVHRKILLVKNVGDEPLVVNQVSSPCGPTTKRICSQRWMSIMNPMSLDQ